VSLQVRPDASVVVREDITFAFQGAHNGIYRTIPVRHERHGLPFVLRVDGIGVYDEAGQALRTEVSRPGPALRIKAWVPGAVDTRKTVTVVYRVQRALLDFEETDELYWNVTGTEWDVPIAAAEATVSGPGPADDRVQVTAYTGALGAAGRDWVAERSGDALVVRTTRALGPRQGLTVVVAWPAGTVRHPGALRRAWWLLEDGWPLLLPLVAAALALAGWHAYGRDPAVHRSVKPEYEPPPGLTPAEVGTLVDERAEARDVVATLVDLAVRGHARIETLGDKDLGDFAITRLRDPDPTLRPFEALVLSRLAGDHAGARKTLAQVRRDYDNVLAPIRAAVYRAMVADRLFPHSPHAVRGGWALAGLALLGGGVALFVTGVGPWGLALPLGVGASGAVLLAFSRFMPRRTLRGARLLGHVRGFQEFLERAERDRLARMPPDTMHRLLPWALALGVSDRWIQAFAGLAVAAPTWYASDDPFDVRTFGHAMKRLGASTGQALTTTRRGGAAGGSSGFGGGGFSGGGFGGGGGGTF
jgi:uncharacterized membrane protein YgcG